MQYFTYNNVKNITEHRRVYFVFPTEGIRAFNTPATAFIEATTAKAVYNPQVRHFSHIIHLKTKMLIQNLYKEVDIVKFIL